AGGGHRGHASRGGQPAARLGSCRQRAVAEGGRPPRRRVDQRLDRRRGGRADHRPVDTERRAGPSRTALARGLSPLLPPHHFSPKGRRSTSNVHAARSWCATWYTVSAIPAGLAKNSSGFDAKACRVHGTSITASMTTYAT